MKASLRCGVFLGTQDLKNKAHKKTGSVYFRLYIAFSS